MRTHYFALSMVLLAGCTSTYSQSPIGNVEAKLISGKAVAIATPANGSYEGSEYRSSGQQTALAVRAAFASFAGEVTVMPGCAAVACLRTAAPADVEYFAVPEILHWEDRATEWSGIKDKMEIRLSIFGRTGDAPLASTVITGKSKWMTFGGDHPQDLLPEPVGLYVTSLYK